MKKAAAVSILPMAALGLSACSDAPDAVVGEVEGEVTTEEPADPATTEATTDPATAEGTTGATTEATDPAAGEPYDGAYDSAFLDDYGSYVGEVVTVTAEVNEIITPRAFTIVGADGGTTDELLVVHTLDAELEEGAIVAVTGTAEEAFALTEVETDLDADLDDALLTDYADERYIIATEVDTP